jgi:hypothetical protein
MGLLVNERYNGPIGNLTANNVDDISELLPSDNIDPGTSFDSSSETTTSTTTSTTEESATTTSSTTTTTVLPQELLFSVSNIKIDVIDDQKAKIESFVVTTQNGLDLDVNLIMEYYLYDEDSSAYERATPKMPNHDLGEIKAGTADPYRAQIDKYVFNLDTEKTLKLVITDEELGITKTIVKKFYAQ